jgi:hypothetical protein
MFVVFVPGRPFQPCLTFVSKASSEDNFLSLPANFILSWKCLSGTDQGILTEGEGSVQLTSSLR